MLIAFSIRNYRCFRDEAEWDAEAAVAYKEQGTSLWKPDLRGTDHQAYLTVSAIYGPNGTGKSTIVEAMQELQGLVRHSDRYEADDAALPHHPFKLDAETALEPTTFSIEVAVDGLRFAYSVAYDAVRIRHERLEAYPKGYRQTWYERDERGIRWSSHLRLNKTYEGLISDKTLVLTWLGKNPNVRANDAARSLYAWFGGDLLTVRDSLDLRNLYPRTGALIETDPVKGAWIRRLIRSADLGIRDVRIEREPDEGWLRGQAIDGDIRPRDLAGSSMEPGVVGTIERVEDNVPDRDLRRFVFDHVGDHDETFSLPFAEESNGTQQLTGLAGCLSDVLEGGGTLVVDELDSSIHPLVLREIVALFLNPEVNLRGAQLIFTAHDTALLDSGLLRRDAIWFTQKTVMGASTLTPLSDYRVRKEVRLGDWYLGGRFDSIPVVEQSFDMPPLAPASA